VEVLLEQHRHFRKSLKVYRMAYTRGEYINMETPSYAMIMVIGLFVKVSVN